MKPTYQQLNTAGITQILELAILSDLRKNPKSKTFEVADATGCPLNTAYSTLRRLCDLSLVEQRNTRPNASEWILTQKGANLISNHLPRPASADSGENPLPESHYPSGVVAPGGQQS